MWKALSSLPPRGWLYGSSVLVLMFATGAGVAVMRTTSLSSERAPAAAAELSHAPEVPSTTDALTELRQAWEALRATDGQTALVHLQQIDSALPVLQDQILMMQATAYEHLEDSTTAQATWTQLLETFPNSPLVPQALLSTQQTDVLLERYPAHPVTGSWLLERVQQSPQELEFVRQLAEHHPQSAGLSAHLDRWVQAGSPTFSAMDWQVVADAYWVQREYGKASRSYDLAPVTAQNLYRHARSHHLSREAGAARPLYQALLDQFPDSEDAILGRRRYADISDPQTAIQILKPLADRDIPEAAEALLSLARLYSNASSPQAAQAMRESLWTRFPESDAAATLAWELAWPLAESGNVQQAAQLAQRIGLAQKHTEMGAQLSYWAGKWQAQLGDQEAARQIYNRVIQQFPHTYYAWRSAVQLGWPVGDFQAGRKQVDVQFVPARQSLPEASTAVQALYASGLVDLAWQRWQWEVDQFDPDLTSAQIFTTGLLRNAAGEHLRGINQVTSLLFAPKPDVEVLRQRRDFWQVVYPLHFHDSSTNQVGGDQQSQKGFAQWANQFNLNPLVIAALIRQESRFEPEIESVAGALGLMQVMPSTGAWIAGQLGLQQYTLTYPGDNLYLGAWYLDYTHRTYNDNTVLALASYNGGPGNVAKWLNQLGFSDPDVFIEKIPFLETRGYVKAVLGNYWNYWQLYTQEGETLLSEQFQRRLDG
ncbi:MAG: transglycosylase SLT domain-containing protein [Synechococcaceae cyanobacterium SM2_3_1]|nr:transglycosylase SLT domain-containing protein [Synechococcaceae cyanobacterium SM2_3_1]